MNELLKLFALIAFIAFVIFTLYLRRKIRGSQDKYVGISNPVSMFKYAQAIEKGEAKPITSNPFLIVGLFLVLGLMCVFTNDGWALSGVGFFIIGVGAALSFLGVHWFTPDFKATDNVPALQENSKRIPQWYKSFALMFWIFGLLVTIAGLISRFTSGAFFRPSEASLWIVIVVLTAFSTVSTLIFGKNKKVVATVPPKN